MKNKSVMSVFVSVFLVPFMLHAQITPVRSSDADSSSIAVPGQLPIGSVEELRAYAYERIGLVTLQGWASSSINAVTNDRTYLQLKYVPANGVVDVDELFGLIGKQSLELSVIHPSDQLSFSTFLYTGDGSAPLFYGNAYQPLNQPVRGVSLNVLDVPLDMFDFIPVTIPGVVWSYVVERDQNGVAQRYYYPSVTGGSTVWFPAYFAGKVGETVIEFGNGLEVAYNLRGGAKLTTTQVKVGFASVTGVGTRSYRTNAVYVEVTGDELRRNVAPLSQLIVPGPKDVNWNYFSSWLKDPDTGLVTEYAVHVSVWPQGKTGTVVPQEADITPPVRYVPLPLAPGRYWVRFSYPSGFGSRTNQFYPPYQDTGGKD